MISNSITKIQTTLRCWLARKKFVRDRKAAVSVQAWVRGEQVRATVGREMQELVRKRKEKEAQEAEAARLVAQEKQKHLEEQALSVRLAEVSWESWYEFCCCCYLYLEKSFRSLRSSTIRRSNLLGYL